MSHDTEDCFLTDADYAAAAERYAENRMRERRKRDREFLVFMLVVFVVAVAFVTGLPVLLKALFGGPE